MWSRSCTLLPPGTYGCHTYLHGVNHAPILLIVHRSNRFLSNVSVAPSPSADIVDGNLKSVMRIILALAAHFKPSANHRTAAAAGGRTGLRGCVPHNPLSTVALAQGAAAALASARLDASQPSRVARVNRFVTVMFT